MPDDHLWERAVQQEQLLQGRFLDVRRDWVKVPEGQICPREYVVHPGAVMVVPILDDGRLVVERQFRYPLGQVIIEFPAGKLDPGESRWACAQRELAEETGYRAKEWALAGCMHNAPAYSTEFIEIWFARGLSLGERRLDPGESLDVCTMSEQDVDTLAAQGAITDAKTLIGLLWLQKWRRGEWSLDWRSVASPA